MKSNLSFLIHFVRDGSNVILFNKKPIKRLGILTAPELTVPIKLGVNCGIIKVNFGVVTSWHGKRENNDKTHQ